MDKRGEVFWRGEDVVELFEREYVGGVCIWGGICEGIGCEVEGFVE